MMKFCQRFRIESIGGKYRIITDSRLTKGDIMDLREIGLLGYGQEFKILTPCDGSEEHDPAETMPNPLGPPYFDLQFFVYECLDLVDSSG